MDFNQLAFSGLSAIDAILQRRSVRAFLPDPVPRWAIEQILSVAGRAPSGSNIQPWKVIVLTGGALEAVKSALHERAVAGDPGDEEYHYYPRQWREPYLTRRRATGWGLYGILGIGRDEPERIAEQQARNFLFFDAPVGMFFTIDRDLEQGSWLDYGMFLQNIMIVAKAFGLDTCPQAAFMKYHRTIQSMLRVPKDQLLLCGMSMGRADNSETVNRFTTDRIEVGEYTTFVDDIASAP